MPTEFKHHKRNGKYIVPFLWSSQGRDFKMEEGSLFSKLCVPCVYTWLLSYSSVYLDVFSKLCEPRVYLSGDKEPR